MFSAIDSALLVFRELVNSANGRTSGPFCDGRPNSKRMSAFSRRRRRRDAEKSDDARLINCTWPSERGAALFEEGGRRRLRIDSAPAGVAFNFRGAVNRLGRFKRPKRLKRQTSLDRVLFLCFFF